MKFATACLLGLFVVSAGLAQPSIWNLYVTTDDAPFTSRCDSGSVLNEHELGFVYLDLDQDGPDTTDAPPWCISLPFDPCYPEAAIFSYRNFALSPDGTIHAPLFHGWSGYEPPQGTLSLYIRVFVGDSSELAFVSPVISLPENGDTVYADIPFSAWSCGPAGVARPPCDGDRAYMEFGWPGMPTEICFLSCRQGILEFAVGQSDNAFRPPPMRFFSGCDSNCMSALSPIQNVWDWRYLTSIQVWFGTLAMRDNGCATGELLDSIPVARLDTLTVTVIEQSTLLEWSTSWESGLVSWELWQPLPWGNYDHHLADIQASGNPQGNAYSLVQPDAFQHG